MTQMQIDQLTLRNVSGIEKLDIKFSPGMNIICGPNGIGKTTILECIAHAFSAGDSTILTRHVASSRGTVTAAATVDGENRIGKLEIVQFDPRSPVMANGQNDLAPYILSLKTTRTFKYTSLDSVSKDADKPTHLTWLDARNGLTLTDVKNWFVNRFLYSAHPGILSNTQIENFETAKSCFSQLNSKFSFSKVDAATNEIMIQTPAGKIYYEYLSSGFKSCLSILLGIIKEIEFRFKEINVKEFKGVVLIDELELHLHPEWQSKIADVLTSVFPKIQFIVTTHSPHIIQSAEPSSILALESEMGRVKRRDLPEHEFGFKGWTIEEVLEDVMGMTDTRTELFKISISEFGHAVATENLDRAVKQFKKLDKLLHPNSALRKILRLQLGSLGGDIKSIV